MAEKPVLSLIGPSIRTQLWTKFYETAKQATTLSFEIVFAGHVVPTFTLPDNFIYIQTEKIKPVQCWQIAAMRASGEVMTLAADDLIFSPNAFDEAYSLYSQKQNYKTIAALRMLLRGIDQTHTCVLPRYNPPPDKNPLLVPGGLALFSRKLFLELGGYDRSFIHADSNFDFFLRAHSIGAEFVWTKNGNSDEDIAWAKGTHGIHYHGPWAQADINRLAQLWYPGGGPLLKERTEPFEPFVFDESIYKVSQGAKGEIWV